MLPFIALLGALISALRFFSFELSTSLIPFRGNQIAPGCDNLLAAGGIDEPSIPILPDLCPPLPNAAISPTVDILTTYIYAKQPLTPIGPLETTCASPVISIASPVCSIASAQSATPAEALRESPALTTITTLNHEQSGLSALAPLQAPVCQPNSTLSNEIDPSPTSQAGSDWYTEQHSCSDWKVVSTWILYFVDASAQFLTHAWISFTADFPARASIFVAKLYATLSDVIQIPGAGTVLDCDSRPPLLDVLPWLNWQFEQSVSSVMKRLRRAWLSCFEGWQVSCAKFARPVIRLLTGYHGWKSLFDSLCKPVLQLLPHPFNWVLLVIVIFLPLLGIAGVFLVGLAELVGQDGISREAEYRITQRHLIRIHLPLLDLQTRMREEFDHVHEEGRHLSAEEEVRLRLDIIKKHQKAFEAFEHDLENVPLRERVLFGASFSAVVVVVLSLQIRNFASNLPNLTRTAWIKSWVFGKETLLPCARTWRDACLSFARTKIWPRVSTWVSSAWAEICKHVLPESKALPANEGDSPRLVSAAEYLRLEQAERDKNVLVKRYREAAIRKQILQDENERLQGCIRTTNAVANEMESQCVQHRKEATKLKDELRSFTNQRNIAVEEFQKAKVKAARDKVALEESATTIQRLEREKDAAEKFSQKAIEAERTAHKRTSQALRETEVQLSAEIAHSKEQTRSISRVKMEAIKKTKQDLADQERTRRKTSRLASGIHPGPKRGEDFEDSEEIAADSMCVDDPPDPSQREAYVKSLEDLVEQAKVEMAARDNQLAGLRSRLGAANVELFMTKATLAARMSKQPKVDRDGDEYMG